MSKILIVDDEPNIVMALEYSLKKAGYTVFIARDGHEALELADRETPDLVVLDIMMPQMDGYQTLGEIKKRPALSHTKVVFLSAKNKPEDIKTGMELGAAAFITKPFSIKKILNTIQEHLEN